MNPMIRKELRQLMRERRGWVLPSLYLVALGGVAIFVYFQTLQMQVNAVRFLEGPDIGIPLFLALLYTQLTVLLLLVPIFSAGALTIEKEQRTMAGLLTSLLTDTHIWWGKFLSSLLFVLLLLVAGLPVLSLAFAFGGVGLWELFIVTITTVVILGSMSAVSLYWSSVFRRSVAATAVSYASVIVLCVVSALLYVAQEAAHRGAAWVLLFDLVPDRSSRTISRVVSLSRNLCAPRHSGSLADHTQPSPQHRGIAPPGEMSGREEAFENGYKWV
jgi:ABC-2 type transport system permease protein